MTHWAILVGINYYGRNYSEDDLQSCVADVEVIKDFLINGPFQYNIVPLTSTKPVDDLETQPPEQSSSRATIKNFLKQFEFVEAHGKEGDNVYIHYSGHGTQRKNDVALTFYHEKQGKQYYYGDRLASWVKKLVEKEQMLVTVVFDCCFSGATKRHGGYEVEEVRYRAYNPLVDTYESEFGPDDAGLEPAVLPMRNAEAIPQWEINPVGYTFFCACTTEQEARGVEVYETDCKLDVALEAIFAETIEETSEGSSKRVKEYRGALSYILLEALKQLAGSHTAVHDHTLHRHICAIFHAKIPTQNPIRYGNKHSSFFANISSAPDNKITSVIRIGDQLILKNGAAHGVLEGDKYELFILNDALSVSDRAMQERESRFSEKTTDNKADNASREQVIVRVSNVRGLTSDLAAIEVGRSIEIAENGWMARPLTQLPPQNFTVQLQLPDHVIVEWSQQTVGLTLLRLCEQKTAASPCLFTVMLNAQEDYEICDASLQRIPTLPAIPSDQQNAKHVLLDVLEHITTFKYVESITNRLPDQTLANSFTVDLVKKNVVSATPSSGILQVKDGEEFSFELSNLSDAGLFVYLYILNPDWSIEDGLSTLTGGETQEVTPENSPLRGTFSAEVPDIYKAQSVRQVDEVFKFFVTRRPDSFAPLQMPALSNGQTRGPRNDFREWLSTREESRRADPGVVQGEDWVSVNLIVRTTLSGV